MICPSSLRTARLRQGKAWIIRSYALVRHRLETSDQVASLELEDIRPGRIECRVLQLTRVDRDCLWRSSIVSDDIVRVSYLELTQTPAPIPTRAEQDRITAERLGLDEYLTLYERVGMPLRWDQRFKMPRAELECLLKSARSQVYVLRDAAGQALGFCEFERDAFSEVELKNFGLVPSAQGRGLGSWLLLTALHQEWELRPRRIWLHTDDWDHPAALPVYERAGFRIYMVRDEPPTNL